MSSSKDQASSSDRHTRLLYAAVGVGIGLLLRDPVHYLISPHASLETEAGWLSYREDRSRRIDLLLWLGADPNAPNDDDRGYAAIHSAALWGNEAVVRKLVAAGANPNLKTADGRTPLDLACGTNEIDSETIEALSQVGGLTSEQTHTCTKAVN